MTGHTRMRAVVDPDLCASASQCVLKAPNAFHLDVNGLSVFDPHGQWTGAELTKAADACPMAAIELIDAEHTE
ncbi:ferredoxin [Mycobacterium sp.]|uniref:ferredoxin n=1 Tax=Mycobacterium sp. TaxID=1785 RepID=UPI003D0C1924